MTVPDTNIDIVELCPAEAEEEPAQDEPPSVDELPALEPVAPVKKPRAKRVAKPKAAPISEILDVPPPPPLVREPSVQLVEEAVKKPRAKRAPAKPKVVVAQAPIVSPSETLTPFQAIAEQNGIQDLLARHLMDMRCRKTELKQQRMQQLVAGKLA